MKTEVVESIFQNLQNYIPTPSIELNYYDSYTLLVAVILSAQATDISVNKVTSELFIVAPTPQKMLALGKTELKKYIKSIGLYNSKADYIIDMSKKIICDFGGKIPNTIEQLTTLAGVGRKSANVILNVIFNQPTIAVDTHVFRVANRLGLCETKTPKDTEFALMKVIPKKWIKNAHILLVLHGRYVCKAKNPNCSECTLKKMCNYFNKNFL